METTIIVATIAALASIGGAIFSFVFTKRKEREAEWRKQKIEHYKELLLGISGIVGTDSTPEANLRFAKASNTIVLVASPEVVQTLCEYQNEIAASNINKSGEKHDELLKDLLLAVRRDIGLPSKDDPANFPFKLWCSGTNEDLVRQLAQATAAKNNHG
ncbi:MAG: hypothetical protein ABIU20_01010 [Blastocatellia bacterium]